MTFIRLIAAFSILVLLSLFVSSNLLQSEQTFGTFGLRYLIGAYSAFLLAVTVADDLPRLIKIKRVTLILAAFLFYTITKYYFEADEHQISQVVYGTTQGLLFSLSVGLVASYALFTIYNLFAHKQLSGIITLCTIGYLIFVAASLYYFIQAGAQYSREDAFRILDNVSYQRPGDLLIVQLLITSCTAILLLTRSKQFKFIIFVVLLVLIMTISALTGILSQLFWSNKGLLAGGGIAFIYIVCSFAALRGRADQNIGVTNILLSRLGLYLLLGMMVGVTTVAATAIGALDLFNVEYTQLRLFEREDEIRSVSARTELFRLNFLKHFEYSPIFGHTQVEKIFGDHGQYVHSTLSVLTHLGVVGFIMFLFLVIGLYMEITGGNSAHREDVLSNNSIYGLLRLGLFSFILAMGLYSAFFTWMPLWFSIGFLGTWFSFKSNEKKHHRKKRKRRSRHTKTKKHTHPSATFSN